MWFKAAGAQGLASTMTSGCGERVRARLWVESHSRVKAKREGEVILIPFGISVLCVVTSKLCSGGIL